MDIRHLTLDQYRYFRDVGLGGHSPDSQVDRGFRGWAPHRNRAAADLALSTGMRWREWATVLLPELGIGVSRPGQAAEFTVQACAKYGKRRSIYVPEGAIDAVETYLLLERPDLVAAAAKRLGQRHRDLFVVSRIDSETRQVHGVLDSEQREFAMSAMPADVRRIAVREGEFGLEALAVFVCGGGLMPGADSWKRYRHAAWKRMVTLADENTPRLPAKRWRWHDLRHSYALALLTYLERQMDGEEPDYAARRRRHLDYLTGNMRHNPLLIVSRRLGHSTPATTYAYLEYTDDLINDFEEAFAGWVGDEDAAYERIAAHAFRLETGMQRGER
jgi:integrase